MNLFGMGMWEIMIIMIAALVIFGPGKLPEVAGQVGRAIRDFRRMTTELTTEFEQNAGVKELKNEIAGIRSELTGATEGVKREMSSVAKSANKSVSSAKAAATAKKPATTATATKTTTAAKASSASTTASKSTTKAATGTPKPVASKADPLADVSFLDEPVLSAPVLQRNGHTRLETTVAGSDAPAVETTSPTSNSADDALTRARRRRQQAGYGRPHL